MDRRVSLGEDFRIGKMALKGLNIMRIIDMVLAHVLFKCSLSFTVNLIAVRLLGFHDAFHDVRVFHHDVKTHLEGVMHFKLIAEALLLLIRINVAECLTAV